MKNTYQLKRTGFKRRGAVSTKKRPTSIPVWLKAIPEGSHGSGTYQKRLWKLTSDFVRIRDWHIYNSQCIATGTHISHWSEGQAGHFKAWSKCNGMFKFNTANIHLQTAKSNTYPDKDDWKNYELELTRRYGENFVKMIETTNLVTPLPMSTVAVIEKIEQILIEMKNLPEQPAYYARVMQLKSTAES